MSCSRNFLFPWKQSLALITSSASFRSHPSQSLNVKFGPLTRLKNGFEPVIRSRFSGFESSSSARRISSRNSYFSGNKIRIGSGVLASSAVFGSICIWPRVSYAMNELDVPGHNDTESHRALDSEDKPNVLWKLVKKFWLPLFFFLTVFSSLNDPTIVFKVILFLLSTNPNPYSVYVFVNELCRRSMHQEPHLYNSKSLYAHRVEVQDYMILCLAKVEIRDQKFTLVGILGGWWALPRTVSLLMPKALEHC